MGGYADISDDGAYYGRVYTAKDGTSWFEPMGAAVKIDTIYKDIEASTYEWNLSYLYCEEQQNLRISRGMMGDAKCASFLATKGVDVTRHSFDTLVEVLQNQEQGFCQGVNGMLPPVINVHRHIGWIELPDTATGKPVLCYRSSELLGPQKGQYVGPMDIKPRGDYQEWKDMVIRDILGHITLELVLVAALAAVVNGLIAPQTNNENPILHLNYSSGKGKSTAGYLAVSTAGRPFEGSVPGTGINGEQVRFQSLYQSWGGTDNAIVATQSGNRGAVVVLNELGKSRWKNIGQTIYYLSEGGEKSRYSGQGQTTKSSEQYYTVFISTGEMSLLDKCQSKSEGLQVRVLELSQPLTDSADHANRIKNTCREHCGHAAPCLPSTSLTMAA